MLEVKIKIIGKTTDDLTIALEEVRRLIGEGYVIGKDGNDTGRYYFTLTEAEDTLKPSPSWLNEKANAILKCYKEKEAEDG